MTFVQSLSGALERVAFAAQAEPDFLERRQAEMRAQTFWGAVLVVVLAVALFFVWRAYKAAAPPPEDDPRFPKRHSSKSSIPTLSAAALRPPSPPVGTAGRGAPASSPLIVPTAAAGRAAAFAVRIEVSAVDPARTMGFETGASAREVFAVAGTAGNVALCAARAASVQVVPCGGGRRVEVVNVGPGTRVAGTLVSSVRGSFMHVFAVGSAHAFDFERDVRPALEAALLDVIDDPARDPQPALPAGFSAAYARVMV